MWKPVGGIWLAPVKNDRQSPRPNVALLPIQINMTGKMNTMGNHAVDIPAIVSVEAGVLLPGVASTVSVQKGKHAVMISATTCRSELERTYSQWPFPRNSVPRPTKTVITRYFARAIFGRGCFITEPEGWHRH